MNGWITRGIVAAGLSAMVSCGNNGLSMFQPPKFVNPNETQMEEISDENAMGVGALDSSGAAGRASASFTTEEVAALEGQIEWAPTNPDEKFDLGAKGKRPQKYETWTKNYQSAMRDARQQGKPLLIWFSDSGGNVISNRLSNELFSRPDFDGWVKDRFATLLVDKTVDTAKFDEQKVDRIRDYNKRMRERFSVRGTPEVVVVDANGEVQERYRGYRKGEAEFYWGRLKIAHENAVRSHGEWLEKMEAKGYRTWHSMGDERKLFAKMLGAKDGKVALVTPEGKRYVQPISRFSKHDQRWVEKNRKP